jgi:hypothetical protein
MLAIWASSRDTVIFKKIYIYLTTVLTENHCITLFILLKLSTFHNGSNILTVVKTHI